jgi:hypothetical protein
MRTSLFFSQLSASEDFLVVVVMHFLSLPMPLFIVGTDALLGIVYSNIAPKAIFHRVEK